MSTGQEILVALPLAAGTGLLSAWLPLINAEAVLAAAGLTMSAPTAVGVGLALAGGQTAGKVALFAAARRGSQRQSGALTLRVWQQRLLNGMRGRRRGNVVVLLSASLGMPPLAVVSLAAGAMRGRRSDFIVFCLFGRAARFSVVLLTVWWTR